MTARKWILAVATLGGLSGFAPAQQSASSFFTGVSATQIRNTPLDTSKAIAQKPGQSALTSNRFDFTYLFNKLTIPTYPPKKGISPLPPPSSFPSTHYENFKTVGKPPFPLKYMFGNKSPIQPVAPFIPNTSTPVGPGSN
ncbi:MAG: hypothetical protein K1X57_01280 [Gemmataceae bacterium]|nr:hypothetical protein [Gemmataceae bacterium]